MTLPPLGASDARDRTRVRFRHGFADNREGLLAHLVVRYQVMRLVVPDPADRIGWHETVDVDGAGAFERDSIKFLVLEHHVLASLALIAFDLIFGKGGSALP